MDLREIVQIKMVQNVNSAIHHSAFHWLNDCPVFINKIEYARIDRSKRRGGELGMEEGGVRFVERMVE